MRLTCWTCHKSCSNELPKDTVLRGTVTCPECEGKKVETWAKLKQAIVTEHEYCEGLFAECAFPSVFHEELAREVVWNNVNAVFKAIRAQMERIERGEEEDHRDLVTELERLRSEKP